MFIHLQMRIYMSNKVSLDQNVKGDWVLSEEQRVQTGVMSKSVYRSSQFSRIYSAFFRHCLLNCTNTPLFLQCLWTSEQLTTQVKQCSNLTHLFLIAAFPEYLDILLSKRQLWRSAAKSTYAAFEQFLNYKNPVLPLTTTVENVPWMINSSWNIFEGKEDGFLSFRIGRKCIN